MPVTISINSTNSEKSTTSSGSPGVATEKVQPGQRKGSSLAKGAINTALIQGAKQVITKGVNVYTDISGNEAMGRQIDGTLSAVTDMAMIAKGGVAGLAVVAAKHAMTAINSQIETAKANYEIEKRNELLGEISMKGSRY